jgi:hypothetical protein
MTRISKYHLGMVEQQEICLAYGSQPLCVKESRGSLILYVKETDEKYLVNRTIFIYGAGSNPALNLPAQAVEGEYVDTVETEAELIWHIFIK